MKKFIQYIYLIIYQFIIIFLETGTGAPFSTETRTGVVSEAMYIGTGN